MIGHMCRSLVLLYINTCVNGSTIFAPRFPQRPADASAGAGAGAGAGASTAHGPSYSHSHPHPHGRVSGHPSRLGQSSVAAGAGATEAGADGWGEEDGEGGMGPSSITNGLTPDLQ